MAPYATHHNAGVTVHGDMSIAVFADRGDDHYWSQLDKLLGIQLRPKSRLREILPEGSKLMVEGVSLPVGNVPVSSVFYAVGDQLCRVQGQARLARIGFRYSPTVVSADYAPRYAVQNGDPAIAVALDRPYMKQLRGLHRKLAGVKAAWLSVLPDIAANLPAYASWAVHRDLGAAVAALAKEWAETGDIASFAPGSPTLYAWHAPMEYVDNVLFGRALRISGQIKIV